MGRSQAHWQAVTDSVGPTQSTEPPLSAPARGQSSQGLPVQAGGSLAGIPLSVLQAIQAEADAEARGGFRAGPGHASGPEQQQGGDSMQWQQQIEHSAAAAPPQAAAAAAAASHGDAGRTNRRGEEIMTDGTIVPAGGSLSDRGLKQVDARKLDALLAALPNLQWQNQGTSSLAGDVMGSSVHAKFLEAAMRSGQLPGSRINPIHLGSVPRAVGAFAAGGQGAWSTGGQMFPAAPPRSLGLPEEAMTATGKAVRELSMAEVRTLTLALAEAVAAGKVVSGCCNWVTEMKKQFAMTQ